MTPVYVMTVARSEFERARPYFSPENILREHHADALIPFGDILQIVYRNPAQCAAAAVNLRNWFRSLTPAASDHSLIDESYLEKHRL